VHRFICTRRNRRGRCKPRRSVGCERRHLPTVLECHRTWTRRRTLSALPRRTPSLKTETHPRDVFSLCRLTDIMTMMKTYEITSLTNEKIKHWTKLSQSKHRRETGLFLAEGYHLVQEAALAGLIDTLILVKGKQIDIEAQTIVEVTEEIMKKLCGTESLSDVVAVCRLWKQEGELGERVLLLDQLQSYFLQLFLIF